MDKKKFKSGYYIIYKGLRSDFKSKKMWLRAKKFLKGKIKEF